MLNIAYTHASVVFHKISTLINTHFHNGGCVICISYKVAYLDKEQIYKNSTKEVIKEIFLFCLIVSIETT